MQNKEAAVLAYLGPESEVVFLRSVLEGSGIACSTDIPVRGRSGIRDARLFVAQADVEAAAPFIADFRQQGIKSGL